jgi:CRISPR-associated exonuclease Cas4
MSDTTIMEAVRSKSQLLQPLMTERLRRQWAACEAESLGRGGVSLVARATGLSRTTIWAGQWMRRDRGLGEERTVALDNVMLTSRRLGLTGRPDRLVKADGTIIPEEWKSSRRVWPSHRAQMGTYFLLIEEELRIRPTHGFIVLGDGTRHRIENTSELRAYVLELSCRVPSA